MPDYSHARPAGAHIAPGALAPAFISAPSHWIVLLAAYALLALGIMWWRWGGTVEDSLHYFETARYLRGELPLQALTAPFPYRLLVPALAYDLGPKSEPHDWR